MFDALGGRPARPPPGPALGLDFMDLLKRFVEILGVPSVGDYIPWLSWIDRLRRVEERAQNVSQDFDDFLKIVIEEHLEKKVGEKSPSNEDQDLVDVLLDVLKDNTADFILYTKAVIMGLVDWKRSCLEEILSISGGVHDMNLVDHVVWYGSLPEWILLLLGIVRGWVQIDRTHSLGGSLSLSLPLRLWKLAVKAIEVIRDGYLKDAAESILD
ncbi:cytochrome P450 71A2-like protein [Tanacetum coccineum]